MQPSSHVGRFVGPSISLRRNTSKQRLAARFPILCHFGAWRFRQLLSFIVDRLSARSLPLFRTDRLSQRSGRRGQPFAWHRQIRLELLEQRALLTWIGALSGATNDAAHNYNNLSNWDRSTIDD